MSTTALKLSCLTLFGILLAAPLFAAEVPAANYDEAKVPEYVLPDPLVAADGTKIETALQWTEKRRPELLELFKEHVYGRVPRLTSPDSTFRTSSMVVERDENAIWILSMDADTGSYFLTNEASGGIIIPDARNAFSTDSRLNKARLILSSAER